MLTHTRSVMIPISVGRRRFWWLAGTSNLGYVSSNVEESVAPLDKNIKLRPQYLVGKLPQKIFLHQKTRK